MSEFVAKNNIKSIASKKISLLPTPDRQYGLSIEKNKVTNILIKDTTTENEAKRNKKVNEILEEVIDLTIDPPLYWRKGNENDIGTSTEDLHEDVNERDIEKLIDHANMSKKTLERKTDRQIIATLAQEVAIKNQYIKGLENKSDQFEKRILFLEKYIVDLDKGKNLDTLLIPMIDVNQEMIMRKQDLILEQLKCLKLTPQEKVAEKNQDL